MSAGTYNIFSNQCETVWNVYLIPILLTSIEKTKSRFSKLLFAFIKLIPATFLITYSCMNNAQNKPNKLIIIFWIISFSGDRFIPETFENAYKVLMKLTILSVDIADLGLLYKCVAKNSLGDTDGAIKLYRKYIS